MKITQLYLVGIALLMYMSYSAHRDEYRQKQQQAEIHKLYYFNHRAFQCSKRFNLDRYR